MIALPYVHLHEIKEAYREPPVTRTFLPFKE